MKYTVYSEAESPFTCDFLNEGEVGSKGGAVVLPTHQ